MKKPIVGAMQLVDVEKESLWMIPGYMDGIRYAGGLPIMLPLTSDKEEINGILKLCDGFLFTGGQDVSPERYKENNEGLSVSNDDRDQMEFALLEKAMECNKPILGICRGLQVINVALGGTLYQDIPSQYISKTNHHMKAPYDREQHKVTLSKEGKLYELLKEEEIGENSYHHQAIRLLAPDLQIMAKSEDGLIEAVCEPEKKFLWAIQWHPELSYLVDDRSKKIFEVFISAMMRSKEN